MDKYHETNKKSKKNYNSDNTFVQISKELHKEDKEYCKSNNIKADLQLNTISQIGTENSLYGNNYLNLNGNILNYPPLPSFTSDTNGLSLSLWFRSRVTVNTPIIRLLQLNNNSDQISIYILNNNLVSILHI